MTPRSRRASAPPPRSLPNASYFAFTATPKNKTLEIFGEPYELFKQFSDNESFRRWLTDTVFGLTYSG